MKTLIFSYLFSIVPLAIFLFPTVQIASFEALTRIGFYLGFPLAIVISLAVIVVRHLVGDHSIVSMVQSATHNAAHHKPAGAELKAS